MSRRPPSGRLRVAFRLRARGVCPLARLGRVHERFAQTLRFFLGAPRLLELLRRLIEQPLRFLHRFARLAKGRRPPAALLPGRAEGFVDLRLRALEDLLERGILRVGFERVRQAQAPRLVGVLLQARAEERVRLRLGPEEHARQKALRQPLRRLFAARAGDAPLEELAQLAVHLALPRVHREGVPVVRTFERRRRARAAAPGLLHRVEHAPVLELERHRGHRVAIPGRERVRVRGRARKQQRRAQRFDERRLAEIVRPVDHVEPRAELDLRAADAAEVRHLERAQLHERSSSRERALEASAPPLAALSAIGPSSRIER